jgi:hypothetical protein
MAPAQLYSRVVIHNLGVGLVEAGSQVSLSSGQTNGIADTLTQRTCRAPLLQL